MTVSVSAAFAFLSFSTAVASLQEDFDGGGTTPFTFTRTSGATPPAVLPGTDSGNFARLTYLESSDLRSLAFDEEPSMTGPAPLGLRLGFDFRMSDDARNADAGGCCGSAADGMGIGLFATARYGSTGGVEPTGTGSGDWERPSFEDAFAVGLDIFQNIDTVSLNWGGTEVASVDLHGIFDLNDFVWHRMIVEVLPSGTDAKVDVSIVGDVFGISPFSQPVFSGLVIAGMDLATLPGYRVIAGGRTGGAFVLGDLDNISVKAVTPSAVPDGGATLYLLLVGLGTSSLFIRRGHAPSAVDPL